MQGKSHNNLHPTCPFSVLRKTYIPVLPLPNQNQRNNYFKQTEAVFDLIKFSEHLPAKRKKDNSIDISIAGFIYKNKRANGRKVTHQYGQENKKHITTIN